jgi:aryl-alcohol dehydrogenase-like predicted oxidoreductase
MILGTAQLGQEYGIHNSTGKPSQETAYQILDYAWKQGIHILDTAGAYGDAEDLIGNYQEATGHTFHICTKLSADVAAGSYGIGTNNKMDADAAGTAERMERELEKSLRRLRRSQIWLYYLHRFEACKSQAVMQKMEGWKAQGRIKMVGISIYEPEELRYIVEHLPDAVDVVQIPFHLLDNIRWLEAGLLQKAREKGIQIFARSIFLQGLFFQEPDSEIAKKLLVQEALSGLHQLAGKYSIHKIQQLAVSFVAGHPCIDQYLLGCETVEQLMQNIALAERAGKRRLTDVSLKKIADLSRQVNGDAIDPRKWKERLSCAS